MTGLTPAPVAAEITADDIDDGFTPLARPDVASVAIESEMVLGRIAAGTQYVQTCALNESGAVVWQCFDGTGTIADIAADIAEVFGVDFAAVNDDVVALARNVGSLGFLVGVREDTFDVGDGDGTEGIAIGEPFPDFDAIDETGGSFSSTQLRGRRILLVNWSSTCSFCDAIVDDLAELAPALGRVGVDIVLLAAG
ncbi:MAG TPA: PqqD family peptide modification chaperone, partial [Acidimicrobiia bacterium]